MEKLAELTTVQLDIQHRYRHRVATNSSKAAQENCKPMTNYLKDMKSVPNTLKVQLLNFF